MQTEIIIGSDSSGNPVQIDLEELLATRLLVQGNSGSGKSHLLRRLLEESAGSVQQVVIDPEGDFTSLADLFPHVVIDGAAHSVAEIAALARRVREHRASVVLALESLDVEQQIRCAAHFLNALFDAPREHWFPALVVVDEAQMFAPSASGEISEDTRRLSLGAMTNLMCRGRKRGLAGIVATQRLAKLAKNVAAEASNFLMGRTFLDIDMARAADLLGMERRQAEQIRDLERGRFLGLGPAISRRPLSIAIGSVRTGAIKSGGGLLPLPEAAPEDMQALLHSDLEKAAETAAAEPRAAPLARNMEAMEQPAVAPPEAPAAAAPDTGEREVAIEATLREMAADPNATYQSSSSLFQAFQVRCRQHGIIITGMDMSAFRRQFAFAVAGLDALEDEQRAQVEALAGTVDDDLLAPFLVIARAALEGMTAPDEEELARVYGTSSPGRIRRLLEHLETTGLIVLREEYGGGRTIFVPGLDQVLAN
ncbi:MAG: ATP-binding protein [Sphingomonadaceae bacterium]